MRQAMAVIGGAMIFATAAIWQAPVQSAGNNPLDFLGNIFGGEPKPDQTSSPPAVSTGAQPWSGEDGASGHPLMTADAIRQAAANFDNCIASMWPDAARRNISQESFQRFTA